MKRLYWISGAILGGFGCVTVLLSRAYSFIGLLFLGLAAVVLTFGGIKALRRPFPKGATVALWVLRGLLALGLALAIVTGILVGIGCGGSESTDPDYVIVLGAGVNGTVPSRSLRERLEAAKTYLDTHPKAIAILSGGKGHNEHISEAECMFRWLTARGISPDRLRLEDKATSTEENIAHSLALIQDELGCTPKKCAVISSEYHLFRAGLMGKEQGVILEGSPARTDNRWYFSAMIVREIVCVWAFLLT